MSQGRLRNQKGGSARGQEQVGGCFLFTGSWERRKGVEGGQIGRGPKLAKQRSEWDQSLWRTC